MFVNKGVLGLLIGLAILCVSFIIYGIVILIVDAVSNYKEKKADEEYQRRLFIRNIDSACDDVYKIRIYCEMFEKYFKKGKKNK